MGFFCRKNVSFALCVLIGLILIGEINVGVDAEKEIPATKFSQTVSGPTMSFFYCYSCGYRKAYEDYVGILTEKYPQIQVSGANYEPPGVNMHFSMVNCHCSMIGPVLTTEPYMGENGTRLSPSVSSVVSRMRVETWRGEFRFRPYKVLWLALGRFFAYRYMSKLIFVMKILLIVVIVSSYDVFGAIGQQTPGWWRHLLENKLYACMMIFFIGNMVEGQLVSSGAFEIELNDVPVWSKLETGRIPAPQELFQIIDNQLQFTDKIQENSDFVK